MRCTTKTLFISLILCVCFTPSVAAPELFPASNVSDTRTFKWIEPAIVRLNTELGQVVKSLRKKGIPIDLASFGAYGSGFLRYVAAGRDLDTLTVFDLGSVEYERSPEETILNRMEDVLKTFAAKMRSGKKDPGLVPFAVDGLGKNGGLAQRFHTKVMILEALNSLRQDTPLDVRLRSRSGRMVPWLLPPGELVLPISTKAFYFTNLARYRETMDQAVRTITVEIFFFVRIKDRRGQVYHLLMEPSFPKFGARIILRNNQFFVVFPSADKRKRLVKIVGKERAIIDRINSGTDLITAAERELGRGRIFKALKRLYQARELLGPMFTDKELAPLDGRLKSWFKGPAASVFHDLEEVAETMTLSIKAGDYKTFVDNGDVTKTTKWYQAQCVKFSKSQPDHRTLIMRLHDQLGRAEKSMGANQVKAWEEVQSLTFQVSQAMAPPREPVAQWIKLFRKRLDKAGISQVPVSAALGDRIFVLKEELDPQEISPSSLRTYAYGGFRFAVIPKDVAADVIGAKPVPPSRYMWLRINPSSEENRFFDQVQERFRLEQ